MRGDTTGQTASVTNDKGVVIFVDPSDSRGVRLVESGGNLNPQSMALWEHALRMHKWDVVVDVGCNYGEMLVSAAIPDDAAVIAFEPNPAVLPYLERTLADWGRNAELVRSAVSAHPAENADFLRDTSWSGSSRLALHHSSSEAMAATDSEHESVNVTTLDAVLSRRGYSSACVKIDVEGGEADALAGATEVLGSLDRWVVMVEILHMTPEKVSELVSTYNVYVHDKRTLHLVRIHSETPAVIHKLLGSGWVYAQDALLVKSPDMVPQW